MSRHDAELKYDGLIPDGVIDPSAPDRFVTAAHAVRSGAIRLKPEAIIARMARAIATLAVGGTVTEGQLRQLGFSETEIAAYGPDALRAAMLANPTFETMELAA